MVNPVRPSGFRRVLKKTEFFWRLIYRPQIQLQYPMEVLRRYVGKDWIMPAGYRICSPDSQTDLSAWAELLNSEGQFGRWDARKIQSNILDRLVSPGAASLLYHKDEMIGCCSACDDSRDGKKIAAGMWLMLKSPHYGRDNLARTLVFRTGAFVIEADYQQAIGYTDTFRLSAIYLHLSQGAAPVYDCLSSYFKWWVVKRRLRKLIDRFNRRKLHQLNGEIKYE